MPITKVAYSGLRDRFAAECLEKNWRVLDVGGVAAPFLPDGRSVSLDIQPGAEFVGDICQPEVWEAVRAQQWDAVVCSHTLEDVRDPFFALKQIAKVAPRGLIEMPHKHTELYPFDNPAHVGYCHHRWVFTVQDNKLRMMAKWPVTARFSSHGDAFETIPWLDVSLVRKGDLQILFENGLDFEIVNGDFPGQATAGCEGILDDYRNQLAGGL